MDDRVEEVFMSFQHISIRNFRAIASLEIENIKQINLLTGRNNCGKIFVLEAIFLLAGMSNPFLAVTIQNLRGLTLTDNEDFGYLFHGFDSFGNPAISGESGHQQRVLDIGLIYPTSIGIVEQIPGRQEPTDNKPISSTIATEDVPDGLAFDFGVDGEKFHAEVKITPGNPTYLGVGGQVNIQPAPGYRETLRATFTRPATIMNGLQQRLEAVLVRKEAAGIIAALREIEPGLNDVKLGAGGKIYTDIAGIGKLVPINIMGEGIIKILRTLVDILEMKDGILLIDEIENGLHYTALAPLWKAVFKMARESNVQLFIATHSNECIDAMVRTYRTYHDTDMGKDFISLFRVDREGDRHRAFQFDAEILLAGIGEDFEVR